MGVLSEEVGVLVLLLLLLLLMLLALVVLEVLLVPPEVPEGLLLVLCSILLKGYVVLCKTGERRISDHWEIGVGEVNGFSVSWCDVTDRASDLSSSDDWMRRGFPGIPSRAVVFIRRIWRI